MPWKLHFKAKWHDLWNSCAELIADEAKRAVPLFADKPVEAFFSARCLDFKLASTSSIDFAHKLKWEGAMIVQNVTSLFTYPSPETPHDDYRQFLLDLHSCTCLFSSCFRPISYLQVIYEWCLVRCFVRSKVNAQFEFLGLNQYCFPKNIALISKKLLGCT